MPSGGRSAVSKQVRVPFIVMRGVPSTAPPALTPPSSCPYNLSVGTSCPESLEKLQQRHLVKTKIPLILESRETSYIFAFLGNVLHTSRMESFVLILSKVMKCFHPGLIITIPATPSLSAVTSTIISCG